jgi:AraC-like DNA-binding protein
MQKELSFQRGLFLEDDSNHPLHVHLQLEIGIVTSGDALLRSAKEEYRLGAGDIFVGRPFEAHWGSSRPNAERAEWILCLFSPSVFQRIPSGTEFMIPFYASFGTSPVIPSQSAHARAILDMATRADILERSRPAGWQAKQFVAFARILEQIYDYGIEVDQLPADGELRHWRIVGVIKHIIEHIAEPLSMAELSAMAGMGKTLFFQTFKRMTSLAPHAFINRIRIQKAMTLLLYTDEPVLDIAFDCGFATISAFNKNFKAQLLLSPSEYRRKLRGEHAP